MSHHHPRRRLHIDGLRAIAVMGVVLFHFGATWLPGGFTGVDVFFVISGFVISKSIYRDMEDEQFSIWGFYERRARRIIPAFFVVTALTSIVAYIYLFPSPLEAYAKSVVASAFSGANIYFWATAGYFAPASTELPLLHYWSLGVEEQFYAVFPLILWAVFRWAPKALSTVIVGLAIASLAACEVTRHYDPDLAFYMLPFRAFELLIGCTLALKGMRFSGSSAVSLLSVAAGICVTVASMLLINDKMAFPGVLCLAPCLGAALIIWGGEGGGSLPVALLSSKPFLFLGRISYSLYLVHWPVVVFGRMIWPNMDSLSFLIGGVVWSVVLGWASYYFVEQRIVRWPVAQKTTYAVTGAALASLLVAAIPVIEMGGLPGRIGNDVNQILAYQGYDSVSEFRQGTCFLKPDQGASDIDVTTCLPGGAKQIVLWGDSAVAQYYWGLAPLLKSKGFAVGQLTASACPPIQSLDVPSRPNCKPFNDFALKEILSDKPEKVVLGSAWTASQHDLDLLDKTIDQLQKAGIKVVVIGPPSYFKRTIPTILAQRRMVGDYNDGPENDLDEEVSIDRDNTMKAYFASKADVKYLSVRDACADQCKIMLASVPLHFDVMHVTREGSDYYASRLVESILN